LNGRRRWRRGAWSVDSKIPSPYADWNPMRHPNQLLLDPGGRAQAIGTTDCVIDRTDHRTVAEKQYGVAGAERFRERSGERGRREDPLRPLFTFGCRRSAHIIAQPQRRSGTDAERDELRVCGERSP
jgi:hypothetical protein